MRKTILLLIVGVQSLSATSFTIVDQIETQIFSEYGSRHRVVGLGKHIDSIAPLYKNKVPVFYPVRLVQYTNKWANGHVEHAMRWGMQGTTPGGLTHLMGVAFKMGTAIYHLIFDPGQEPSRFAVNVLITIHKDPRKSYPVYYGELHQNSVMSGAAERIDFRQIQ